MSDHNTVGIRLYESTAESVQRYKALADERAAQVARLEAKCVSLLRRLANAKLTNTRLRRKLRAK